MHILIKIVIYHTIIKERKTTRKRKKNYEKERKV